MAQSREQVKPLVFSLSPLASPTHLSRQEDQNFSEKKIRRIRKIVLCCGCVTALVLICVVILLVLAFTVYNVQEPDVRMNAITLVNGTFLNGATNNVTLVADVSMKNPNAFTLRYGYTTSTLYYDGIGIGVGTSPPGVARARRTKRLNVSMEIMAKKLLGIPSLQSDLRDQALNISSYTRIDGKVKILNLFKKKVVVELNCTIQYNISTGLISNGDNCLRRVDI